MQRRSFLTFLGGAAAAWPLAAGAQQRAVPVVGFLHTQSPNGLAERLAALQQGLKDTGFVEGHNLTIEYRWANNQLEQLPVLAADLVRRRVGTIIAIDNPLPVAAAKAATATIPIVFVGGFDPVESGFVASLNRPGGNITGVATLVVELAGKRLDVLGKLLPHVSTFGFLRDSRQDRQIESEVVVAAHALGRQVVTVEASSEGDFEPAFATLVERGTGALLINNGVLFTVNRDKLAALAARYKLPTMYPFREYAVDGGLMSYGPKMDSYRLGGSYVGRILRGEKPADLPVQQSTRLELVINLKTASALGLEVPPTLLALADEVIE